MVIVRKLTMFSAPVRANYVLGPVQRVFIWWVSTFPLTGRWGHTAVTSCHHPSHLPRSPERDTCLRNRTKGMLGGTREEKVLF